MRGTKGHGRKPCQHLASAEGDGAVEPGECQIIETTEPNCQYGNNLRWKTNADSANAAAAAPASARQGAIQMPTLTCWQACQHFQRFTPMIKLTFKLQLSYKQLAQLIVLVLTLLR